MKIEPLWVGIDVGSAELVVAAQRGQEAVKTGTFLNTAAGHATLLRWLKPLRQVQIVLEATGIYHLDLARTLHQTAGVEVMVANPRLAKRFAEAQGQRAKTDQADAQMLLNFARVLPFQPWRCPPEAFWQFRATTRHLGELVVEQTRLKNQQTAADGTQTTPAFVQQLLETQLESLGQWIQACEAEALRQVEAEPTLTAWFRALCTLPGIGKRSGLYLLGELAFLDDSLTSDQVVAHAGLDPRPRQSGKRDAPRRISKAGNARIRGILYMPVLAAMRVQGPLKDWAEKLKEQKKPTFVVQVAVMRRLLRIAWVVMIRKSQWDPDLARPPEQRTKQAGSHDPGVDPGLPTARVGSGG